MKLPLFVLEAIDQLEQHGFETWAVGGCVRDALRGVQPHDFDLCTRATPRQMLEVFAGDRVIETGVKHGTLTVLKQGVPLEITTYRTERGYSDSRHPDEVTFVREVRDDLARRDFTIGAMAYHPARGLFDPFGGQADLARGILRAVGTAETRFQEDALRILRGVRFAAQLGFSVEEETARAMDRSKAGMLLLAPERVREELTRILVQPWAAKALRQYADLVATVLPELRPMFGFAQRNPWHRYDVWEHSLHALADAPPDPVVRWVELLHDSGKPQSFFMDENGVGHFHGHHVGSLEIARAITERLRFDTRTASLICLLVDRHDYPLTDEEKSMRRALAKFGEPTLRLLLAVKKGDMVGQGTHPETIGSLIAREQLLERLLQEQACISLRDLAVSGEDMLALGLEGPAVGDMLEALLSHVLDTPEDNNKARLLSLARQKREAL